MARLVFGMNVSLDGYVDHDRFAPGPELFQHFVDQQRSLAGSLYGRGLYELMAYWDEEQEGWDDAERAFARAWRSRPKWVVSKSLKSVGPNATLIDGDLEPAIRKLKAEHAGVIGVGGPVLARSLGELGLIDEYQLYYRPVVLGSGRPFFTAARPQLKLVANERIGEDAVRLTYVPA